MKLLAVSLLLCAILAVANACCCCCCRVSDMSRYASQQNISEDCQVQFFVLKRDGSELDFHICVKNGKCNIINCIFDLYAFSGCTDSFCTSKEVSPCGATRTDCRGIEEQELADYFADTLPEVKGEVCVEPSGKLCLNTNIVYSTCSKNCSTSNSYNMNVYNNFCV